VKVARGPRSSRSPDAIVPVIVKVVNDSTVTKALRLTSPQAGPIYSGGAPATRAASHQGITSWTWRSTQATDDCRAERLKVEYAIALRSIIRMAGKREVMLVFAWPRTQNWDFRPSCRAGSNQAGRSRRRPFLMTDFDGQTDGGPYFRDNRAAPYPPRANSGRPISSSRPDLPSATAALCSCLRGDPYEE